MQAGFSLVELLVVLLLIGIILAMATLSLRPVADAANGEEDAGRMAAVLQLAREQSVLRGAEHGLVLMRDGYQVLVHGREGWRPLDESAWRFRELPPTWELHLVIEGRAVALPERQEAVPQVRLYPSGEMTAFELEMRDDRVRCILAGNGLEDLAPPRCVPT